MSVVTRPAKFGTFSNAHRPRPPVSGLRNRIVTMASQRGCCRGVAIPDRGLRVQPCGESSGPKGEKRETRRIFLGEHSQLLILWRGRAVGVLGGEW